MLDNPVELEAFNHAIPSPDLYGILPGELSVFYIGQIKAIKGVDIFLDAAEHIVKLNLNVKFTIPTSICLSVAKLLSCAYMIY